MKDPEGIGNWPRRLLHVPSMTSFEWQQGNYYGATRAPKYNILSYTWGRYRLDKSDDSRPKELESVRGISIQGVEWDIPPIDPAHFTEREFRLVLESVAKSGEPDPVEFVWVDVACIDQRRGSAVGSLEVGRQAVIFKGAQRVYIWLTRSQFDANALRELVEIPILFIQFGQFLRQEEAEANLLETLRTIKTSFTALFSDPWFSSLWTLQEAYLSAHAELLSRDGRLINDETHRDLRSFADMMNAEFVDVQRILVYDNGMILREHPQVSSVCDEIVRLVRASGLSELVWSNRMALYAAAGTRTATEPCDYVYAIQQIFNYRLGSTAEDSGSGRDWALDDLEAELGERIITDYPVYSQMHVFMQPTSGNSGWHINRSSRLPIPLGGMGHAFTGVWEEEVHPLAKLSVERIGNDRLGYFAGLIAPFYRLHELWMSSNQSAAGEMSYQRILLDAVSEEYAEQSGEPKEFRTVGHMRDLWPGTEMDRISTWLSHAYPRDNLYVLRLGSRGERPYREVVGVVISKAELVGGARHHWRRLGFCYWSCEKLHNEDSGAQDTLDGNDGAGDWEHQEGFFG